MVEGARLESEYTAKPYRGFESLPLRQSREQFVRWTSEHGTLHDAPMQLRAARSRSLTGVAAIPGDKSCSHRALILGALAQGETRISGLLEADDVMATVRAVEAFGAKVSKSGREWIALGTEWHSPNGPIHCGNSGTSARLLIGAAAGFDLTATFTGDQSLSRRPMARVTGPLSRMGARFEGGDRLPVSLQGGRLEGIDLVNDPASAQVKSAVLLAGLRTLAPVRVSEPIRSRDHTEIMLREFGCDVHVENGCVALGERRQPQGCDIAIATDPSSAAFALTAGSIVPGSSVQVRGMLANPLRMGLLQALQEMGGEVALSNKRLESGERVVDIRIGHAPLRSIHVTADRIPAMIDEVPLLAVAAAFAEGETLIEGLGELRHKESDRLGAIVAGLTACGVTATVHGDNAPYFGAGAGSWWRACPDAGRSSDRHGLRRPRAGGGGAGAR